MQVPPQDALTPIAKTPTHVTQPSANTQTPFSRLGNAHCTTATAPPTFHRRPSTHFRSIDHRDHSEHIAQHVSRFRLVQPTKAIWQGRTRMVSSSLYGMRCRSHSPVQSGQVRQRQKGCDSEQETELQVAGIVRTSGSERLRISLHDRILEEWDPIATTTAVTVIPTS